MAERDLRRQVERSIAQRLVDREINIGTGMTLSSRQQKVIAETALEFVGMDHDALLQKAREVDPRSNLVTEHDRTQRRLSRRNRRDSQVEADHLLATRLAQIVSRSRLQDLDPESGKGLSLGSRITKQTVNQLRRGGK